MITAVYSILHMLVDGVCAYAMFGRFVTENQGYEYFLIYNFCAFALQMPFGAILDSFALKRKGNVSRMCALSGVLFTVLGAWLHPAVLGIGNALFHVGAGICVIREDDAKGWRGQGLGVFVAPGAWGLFIGTQMTKDEISGLQIILTLLLLIMLGIFTKCKTHVPEKQNLVSPGIGLPISCFLVVILRSYVGMAVTFSWKTTTAAATVAVLAVVLGKMAGGILSARVGTKITIIGSLLSAAVCYWFSDHMAIGLLALFLFNMTMPITLYLLVRNWKELPGFAFGLLTFGLFLGFLPIYFEWQIPVPRYVLGAAACLCSMGLLLAGKGRWSE